ncbi:MAG: YajQ family cyclic di-GMP-binding protein [Bifidobacteriaceae bacterium]|jgi:uncharacterized protein YajQ (UPF0234 family)|nr:YajQ family cyclic di-GMP-binding protein [Bifidobacteriaceae bacterium]
MAQDASFDIVSKVDHQEVDNALNQTSKEVSQRYDFRGTGASIAWSGTDMVVMAASSEDRVKAVLDVFETKLVKRKVSLKALDKGEPKQSGKEFRIEAKLRDGLDSDHAKKVAKIVREEGPKGVKVSIMGEEVRVTSKSRDQLQEVIALLRGKDLDVALQFTNYR